MGAVLGDDLADVGADAAEAVWRKRLDVAGGHEYDGDVADGLGELHFADGVRDGGDVVTHADVKGGAGPVGGDDGPDLAGHFSYFFRDTIKDMATTWAGGRRQRAGDTGTATAGRVGHQ